MNKFFLLIIISLFSNLTLSAQGSWRKNVRAAEAALRQSKYAEAAAQYEAAWTAKPKKKKYIYMAGEYYTAVRNYAKAAEAYKNVRDDKKDYPLAQLYYARALKQSGACDKAVPEYADFVTNYGADDADRMRDIVQKEIQGCELAQRSAKEAVKNPMQVSRLNNSVNSQEADFAPVAFADDLLYFSSNSSGLAAIYRSQKQNGNWSKAVVPSGFPDLSKIDFCNGAFSPDNKRFYFTECKADKGLQAQCEIYVMSRENDRWTAPVRLPDNINAKGFTTTHPFVTQLGDKEVLFFASNRTNTRGGMDIWQASRNSNTKDLNFSVPVNLGELINTAGDEITPYYDATENVLYFGSNGHLTIGGFDVSKAKMNLNTNTWAKPENIGAPLNSPADDYYFVRNKSKTGGFLVSNRATKDRQHTANEDIFEYTLPIKNLAVKGKIMDKNNSVALSESRINLYEILANGQKRLLNTKSPAADGIFEFALLPDKKFRIEAEKKGYMPSSFEFTAAKDSSFEKNLYLDVEPKPSENTYTTVYIEDSAKKNPTTKPTNNNTKTNTTTKPTATNNNTPKPEANKTTTAAVAPNTPKNNTTTAPTPSKKQNIDLSEQKGNTSVGTMPLYETTSRDNVRLITSAPKLEGTYYKIQMIAVKRFDIEENRYRTVRDLGRIDTEYIISKDMVRVLLADFFDYDDAQKTLTEVKKNREFSGAYIIKYENGIRIGTGK